MIKLLTTVKLLMLCSFLWAQSAGADHLADASFATEHADCLECKNLNQPIADLEPGSDIAEHIPASNEATRIALEAPVPAIKRADPARAPPTAT